MSAWTDCLLTYRPTCKQSIYAAFEDNKNILLGQTARAVLSDALFERIRNDVERIKITIE